MPEYKYVDVVKLGINAAHARVPRVQTSVVPEFSEMLSREVARGEWNMFDGTAINSAGQNVEQYLDFLISTRPHWLVPATVVDAADDTWTSGNLGKQGKRYNELRKFLGNDKVAEAALREEAALYGCIPGSTKVGVKPGTKPASDESGGPSMHSNPWHEKSFNGDVVKQNAEKDRLLKAIGTEGCARMAAKCGVSVLGYPLKK